MHFRKKLPQSRQRFAKNKRQFSIFETQNYAEHFVVIGKFLPDIFHFFCSGTNLEVFLTQRFEVLLMKAAGQLGKAGQVFDSLLFPVLIFCISKAATRSPRAKKRKITASVSFFRISIWAKFFSCAKTFCAKMVLFKDIFVQRLSV